MSWTWTRRDFLKASLASGAMISVGGALPRGLGRAWASGPADKKLNLLILGGTGFLGPATVEYALERGHTMTLFNRGKTNADMFPELEKLRGDRDGDLAALEGRKWDAVIDTSGYVPRIVKMSADLLADAVDHYVFISSISVYPKFERPGVDEDDAVDTMEDESVETIDGETYGPLKALCEQAAEASMPGRVANIRPGLIVGPRDRTDRFTYWPVRVARGGEVLAPGDGKTPIQVIDVRDLGAWIIHVIEQKVTGVYNTTSPAGWLHMGELLDSCKKMSGSDAKFIWVDHEFLEEQEVAAWSEMPAWLPPEGEFAGFGEVSSKRARDKGLKHRPIDDTVKDTLDWWNEQDDERKSKLRAGIAPEKEEKVLAAWHGRHEEKPAVEPKEKKESGW